MTDPAPDAARAGATRAELDRRLDAHRRELHVHCYRMLGSFDEAEDAVQDTYLKAWRAYDRFEAGEGSGGLRAWLYAIATNTCLDRIRARNRRPVRLGSSFEVGWLQPYPDQLLDEITASDDAPDVAVVARETIELAFLVALQVLPPQQRAALLLRDVLGLPARETAAAIGTTVPAANSTRSSRRLQPVSPGVSRRRPACRPRRWRRESLARIVRVRDS